MSWPPFWSSRLPVDPSLRSTLAQLYAERARACAAAELVEALSLLRSEHPSGPRAWSLACAAERRAHRYSELAREARLDELVEGHADELVEAQPRTVRP